MMEIPGQADVSGAFTVLPPQRRRASWVTGRASVVVVVAIAVGVVNIT